MLWAIGQQRPVDDGESVPPFLQITDTSVDHDEAAAWWAAFIEALTAWWQGGAGEGDVAADILPRLGERSPVKQWLVRLLVHRLTVLARPGGGEIQRLIQPRPD